MPLLPTRRTAIQDDGLGLRRELDPHQTPAVPLSIRTNCQACFVIEVPLRATVPFAVHTGFYHLDYTFKLQNTTHPYSSSTYFGRL